MKTTVKVLRSRIEGLADDTPVLVPGEDHSYRDPSVSVMKLDRDQGGYCDPEGEGEHTALVIE